MGHGRGQTTLRLIHCITKQEPDFMTFKYNYARPRHPCPGLSVSFVQKTTLKCAFINLLAGALIQP